MKTFGVAASKNKAIESRYPHLLISDGHLRHEAALHFLSVLYSRHASANS
ncbi:MAG: hypothetical protein WHT29_08905 [Bacteroidales bacterium]